MLADQHANHVQLVSKHEYSLNNHRSPTRLNKKWTIIFLQLKSIEIRTGYSRWPIHGETFIHMSSECEQWFRWFLISNVLRHNRWIIDSLQLTTEIPEMNFTIIRPSSSDLTVIHNSWLSRKRFQSKSMKTASIFYSYSIDTTEMFTRDWFEFRFRIFFFIIIVFIWFTFRIVFLTNIFRMCFLRYFFPITL